VKQRRRGGWQEACCGGGGGWQEAAAAAAAVARSGLGREDSACLRCGDLQSDQASLVAAEHKVHAYRGPAEQVDCSSGSSKRGPQRIQSLDAEPSREQLVFKLTSQCPGR
jgi:hypothetical protein